GGLTEAGDLLFEPVRRIALASVLAPMAANVRIEPAGLGPNHGVVAAAAIAIERFGISIGADTRAALDEHVTAAEALRRLGPDIDAIGSLIAERLAAG